MKLKFALTIDHLAKNWLLNPKSIKSLKIRWDSTDDKLENIINDLTTNRKDPLTNEQKAELDQTVAKWIEDFYLDLAKKEDRSEELKARNDELEAELNASEAANEVIESAALTGRSLNNMIRVWNSIKNINKNKKWLDPATKARKVLRQANNFTIFGSWKRFDWINKLPRKFDIKEEYNRAVKKLNNEMDRTNNPQVKIAIRYIMKQVDKAYTEYIKAISIDKEERRANMKNINMKMAA